MSSNKVIRDLLSANLNDETVLKELWDAANQKKDDALEAFELNILVKQIINKAVFSNVPSGSKEVIHQLQRELRSPGVRALLVERLDANKDNRVTFREFQSQFKYWVEDYVANRWLSSRAESKSDNGTYTHLDDEAFGSLFANLNATNRNALWNNYDQNGSGTITFDEAKELVNDLFKALSKDGGAEVLAAIEGNLSECDTTKVAAVVTEKFFASVKAGDVQAYIVGMLDSQAAVELKSFTAVVNGGVALYVDSYARSTLRKPGMAVSAVNARATKAALQRFNQADTDNSGALEAKEIEHLVHALAKELGPEADLTETFALFFGDEEESKTEVKDEGAVSDNIVAVVKNLIKVLDTNDDGVISRAEFLAGFSAAYSQAIKQITEDNFGFDGAVDSEGGCKLACYAKLGLLVLAVAGGAFAAFKYFRNRK